MRKLIFIALLFNLLEIPAQNPTYAVVINAITTDAKHNIPLDQVIVTLTEGQHARKLSSNKKQIVIVRIPINTSAIITFKKEGYITKRIEINTDIPGQTCSETTFKIQIILLKKKAGCDYGGLDFILAKIYFDIKLKEFKYDRNYNMKMKNRHAKTLKRIESDQLICLD